MSEIKQIIVVRSDLKMRRGKEAAQVAHASMMFLTNALEKYLIENVKIENFVKLYFQPIYFSNDEWEWLRGSFTKVVVSVDSQDELLEIWEKAKVKGLTVYVCEDSGKTEFQGVPTLTCIAIGPGKAEDIDEITGHLKLR